MTDDDINEQINIASYYLAKKNYPIDKLCWMYAERKLFADNNFQIASIEEIRSNAADLFVSCAEYDIVCWLIAEFDIKHGKKFSRIKKAMNVS